MGIAKFIARFFVFTIILCGVLLGFRYFLIEHYNYSPYPQETMRVQQMEAQVAEIEVLTIGNSHAQSIDFDTMGIEHGYHIWGPGQDLYETYAALQDFVPRAKNLKTVFVPIDRLWTIDNREIQEKRIRFYSMHPSLGPIDGDVDNWIRAHVYFFNKFKFTTIENSWFSIGTDGSKRSKKRFKSATVEQMSSSVQELVDGHHDEISASNTDSLAEEEATAILGQIIELLKANDIRLICFSASVHPTYMNTVSQNPEYKNDGYIAVMDSLCKRFEIEYHDFYNEAAGTWSDQQFYNSDHLNLGDGAPQFSMLLLERINAFAPLQ